MNEIKILGKLYVDSHVKISLRLREWAWIHLGELPKQYLNISL